MKGPLNIVCLELLYWGVSIGGEHYSGNLKFHFPPHPYTSIELTKKLSRKDAIALNKKDETRGYSRHRPGMECGRFNTREEAIATALKVYKSLAPGATVLIVGSHAVGDPQYVAEGPQPFKSQVNRLWRRWEKVGGYEGNERVADNCFRKYQAILKEWKES